MSADRAARFGAVARQRATPPPATLPPAAARKYTVILDGQAAETFDADLTRVRRAAGRVVSKSDVVRELLAVLNEDPALLADVSQRLRATPTR